jgi:MoxR-like ATPase
VTHTQAPPSRNAPEFSFEQAGDLVARLEREVSRVIIGQRTVVREVLTCLLAGGHCLLRGVPGLAKTLLIKTLAEALSLRFSRIQFTPDLMPSDILGAEVIEEDTTTGKRSIRFIPGPVFANIILADEINRTPPRTQARCWRRCRGSVTLAVCTELDRPLFVLATRTDRAGRDIRSPKRSSIDSCSIVIGIPTRTTNGALLPRRRRVRSGRRRSRRQAPSSRRRACWCETFRRRRTSSITRSA